MEITSSKIIKDKTQKSSKQPAKLVPAAQQVDAY